MKHTSYIELSKSALNNNINYLKGLANKDTRFSIVIKANAYGHGIEDLLPMIEECGVDHFTVFSVAEAMRAHKVKQKQCEIMIVGWIDDDHLAWAIENEVSFYIFHIGTFICYLSGCSKDEEACKGPYRNRNGNASYRILQRRVEGCSKNH